MTKGKRLAAAQFQLPEAMIQHIQSFLYAKKAVSLFSKAWYNAWLTRPNLDFDQDHFKKETDKDNERSASRLWKFVNKIVQRYDELNLKIDSLRLWVRSSKDAKYCSYVTELIVKALKMGATALDFKFHDWDFAYLNELFGSENLVALSLSGCEIYMGRKEKRSCSLWTMCLLNSCPLIESLSLSIPEYEFGKLNVVGLVQYMLGPKQ